LLLSLAMVASLVFLGCNSSSAPVNRPITPQEQRGHRLYEAHCAVCHDAYSTKPRQGPGLAGLFQKKYLPSGAPANDERARDSFMVGRRNMPAFQLILDDQQAADLMAYLHTL
jgi:mono/diheme cytochrome c family protein